MDLIYIIIFIIIIFLVIYYLINIRKELFFNSYTDLFTDFELTVTKIDKEEITYNVSFKLTQKVIDEINKIFTDSVTQQSYSHIMIYFAPNMYDENGKARRTTINGLNAWSDGGQYFIPKGSFNTKTTITLENIKKLPSNKKGQVYFCRADSNKKQIPPWPEIINKDKYGDFFTKTLQDFIKKGKKEFEEKEIKRKKTEKKYKDSVNNNLIKTNKSGNEYFTNMNLTDLIPVINDELRKKMATNICDEFNKKDFTDSKILQDKLYINKDNPGCYEDKNTIWQTRRDNCNEGEKMIYEGDKYSDIKCGICSCPENYIGIPTSCSGTKQDLEKNKYVGITGCKKQIICEKTN